MSTGFLPPDPMDPPSELVMLQQRVRRLPTEIRSQLEPLVEEAIEGARFRSQAIQLAGAALRRHQQGRRSGEDQEVGAHPRLTVFG